MYFFIVSPLSFSLSFLDLSPSLSLATPQAHIFKGHSSAVLSIDFDGYQFISGSRDHSARMWDFRAGKPLHTLSGHTDWVRGVACDGIAKAVTCSNDRTIRQWYSTGESTSMHLSNL